jgi:Mg2+ and Co2+ transporter CorA
LSEIRLRILFGFARQRPMMGDSRHGQLLATSPFGLTYAIVSSIARREAEMVAEIAREVGLLEQNRMDASQSVLLEIYCHALTPGLGSVDE